MEKRRSKRTNVSLDVKLTADGVSSSGFIENICEHGLHLITASGQSSAPFIPEAVVDLTVNNPSGSTACLNCVVKWVHINKTPIHGLTYRMGMEILKQPSQYNEMLSALK
ncbi:MAG: PilZ domain-containing protein [Nitrospirae bacterium]|nr:PilZ domain-containing protein [Nitrospirota bacterium]